MGSIVFTLVLAAAPAKAPPPVVVVPPPPPVQVCQAWGPRPPACVEPPLRDMITVYRSWREPQAARPKDMIREPYLLEQRDSMSNASFPAWLRSGDARRTATATLDLVVAADGAIKSCRAFELEAYEYPAQGKSTKLTPDPSLGDQACALVAGNRKFRPAIDSEGRPIEAPVAIAVHYKRERYEMLAPPAPPPPSRFLGNGRYDENAWPPRYYSTDGTLRLPVPQFKDFLGEAKNLPKKTMVGAVLQVANTGQVTKCEVRRKSDDQRLDDATCAALLTVRATTTRFGTYGLPVEVTWQGSKAKMAVAGPHVLPGLASPIVIPPDQIPAQLPKWPSRVRILLDGKGQPQSCTALGYAENDALDAAACKIARQGRFTGAKDGFGRPAVSGVDLWVDWKRGSLTLPGY
ncbi:hypothetical protein OKA06_04485 [Novosphingobium sp. MW5]|nr:hypothetical protein [Novosphingobium sp. MW5]